MVDVFAVADIIVEHIKTHYSEDISIVGYYGSYLQVLLDSWRFETRYRALEANPMHR
ncbi:hypothetical protein FHT67_001642 [Paenibacillus sp. BK720]|nr:hypothetical protein [Paenibacillus sp. BK720]